MTPLPGGVGALASLVDPLIFAREDSRQRAPRTLAARRARHAVERLSARAEKPRVVEPSCTGAYKVRPHTAVG
jgi:hypothetical protein